jgi:hypothetical protein
MTTPSCLRCSGCGRLNDPDAQFCCGCAASLHPEPEPAARASDPRLARKALRGYWSCGNCGKAIPPESNSCPGCGWPGAVAGRRESIDATSSEGNAETAPRAPAAYWAIWLMWAITGAEIVCGTSGIVPVCIGLGVISGLIALGLVCSDHPTNRANGWVKLGLEAGAVIIGFAQSFSHT